ncbi:hypothetical protein LNQ03_08225 [Klebsiella pneumoniae subsp. pneumoniae]|nr:hypothetical protein [Klebsiella pneumoniae subsp. pneumoniae]
MPLWASSGPPGGGWLPVCRRRRRCPILAPVRRQRRWFAEGGWLWAAKMFPDAAIDLRRIGFT